MAQLKDLKVDWVSIVSKAAVRDPTDPTKPRRLLLWKSEHDSRLAGLQEALDKIEREKAHAIAGREAAEKAQKTAEEKLAKAGTHTNTHKEKKNMATGTASESDLSLAQQQRLVRAISMLEGDEDHPGIAGGLEKLRGAAAGESALEKTERALTDMSALRVELAKSDAPNPLMQERVAKLERHHELAYLRQVSGAHQGWRAEQLRSIQKAEAGYSNV
jgi:hypothetical protein